VQCLQCTKPHAGVWAEVQCGGAFSGWIHWPLQELQGPCSISNPITWRCQSSRKAEEEAGEKCRPAHCHAASGGGCGARRATAAAAVLRPLHSCSKHLVSALKGFHTHPGQTAQSTPTKAERMRLRVRTRAAVLQGCLPGGGHGARKTDCTAHCFWGKECSKKKCSLTQCWVTL
jgi:hypothetical protein